MFIYKILQPKRLFDKFIIPLSFVGLMVFLISGLIVSLKYTPSDFQQGDTYRIIYIHVPAAWLSLIFYTIISIFSFIYLIQKNSIIFLICRILALMGLLFTFITLATGIIWAKPMWGSYWVWDARLSSVLVLFIFYLSYFFLYYAFINKIKAMNYSSILILVGFLNLPIIKYSVQWWNTLHQISSITPLSYNIHFSIFIPILIFFIFMIFLSIIMFTLGIRLLYLKKPN